MSRVNQRFRQRKLSTKQNLSILREADIDNTIDDDVQNIPKVETGVEKAEETEHHLQAVISAQASGAAGQVTQLYIPTPETKPSGLQYGSLYPPIFAQPVSNIRFSSTVEDCIGAPYCMSTEDEVFLQSLNGKRPKQSQCSDDQFEEVMNFFEETATLKQPYASVDNPPVLPYEQFEHSFDDESIEVVSRAFARDIYPHWKAERERRNNTPIMPTLKTLNIEKNVELDDSDPYVCFRRREVRLTRKTRGRDAQVAEKLKSLRHELERARQLLHHVKQREQLHQNQLDVDRKIFEQRNNLKEVKRKLGIKGNDEDFINQKPVQKPTKPKLDSAAVPRGIPGVNLKQQLARADGRPAELDLPSLEEEKQKQEDVIQKFIDTNVQRHRDWNKGYCDATWRPITPPLEYNAKCSFVAAAPQYNSLPTPPPSVGSSESTEDMMEEHPSLDDEENGIKFEHTSEPLEVSGELPAFSYRRRFGRGGRLLVDRRRLKRKLSDIKEDPFLCNFDRWHFDQESDEDDEMTRIDPFENFRMRIRISLQSPTSTREAQSGHAAQEMARLRRSIAEASATNATSSVVEKSHSSLQKGNLTAQPG